MGELFDRYPGEILQGKNITIKGGYADMFISNRDEVFWYTGICLNTEDLLKYRGGY